MDLYYGRMSGNSARAAFGLYEAGAAFRPLLLGTAAGENRAPGYLAVNPMGKIPALVDGPFHLWESNAINLYVAEKHPQARLVPAGAEGRASMQRWLFFQVGHVTPASVPVFRIGNPRFASFWKVPQDAAASAAAEAGRKELARFLPVLEAQLAGRDWLEGEFSLADVAFAPHLVILAGGAFDFGPYPNLAGWLRRLQARPAWKRTEALVFP